ncbi:hypothetical protein GIB67_018180 [Kingdonia uniflora]|uniref:Uncharacterized protein n=1 Tax=Kingdonia uniflora TaxID=39325 RepID=A0A7J7NMU2_9MAGN|nr:hypothetical protein GIB67_018180 [Kingdonia uniflora]
MASSKRKRVQNKKELLLQVQSKNQETSPIELPCYSDSKGSEDRELVDVCSDNECSTPKAKRYRIPDIVSCPPAPKKRRALSQTFLTSHRSPISFFASPDIELFFYSTLPKIPNIPTSGAKHRNENPRKKLVRLLNNVSTSWFDIS